MTRRYKAFISYSWADKDWGAWVHRALETYRAPKGVADGRSLHPIFRDREEEAAGRGIGAAIEEALDNSEFLIVLCSPNSAKSQWVAREVAWFKTRRDPDKILALIVRGEPGHATENCFPKALTHKIGPDLQPTEETEDAPLAADARKEGDGKRRAKLKLAAAMLGVGLDDLVRRDERRRTLRRRWAMSGMAAGMAALGGLSLFAFNQRDAAVVARNDAVKARDDAEGLIELVLTDLKSDLEGFGTLKSVTAIGNRAIGYYEGQDVKALTPDQLGRRARVLLMLGEADNKRGDLTAALARYETAAATTSEQLARDPGNAQRIFDHAQSVFWVGYIAWQRGDHAKAKAQFTEYHGYAQRLVEIDPANDDWQAELDYAYSNLGTLAMDEGEAVQAEGWFRKSLEITLAQLEKNPDDVDRVIAAGQSYAWLGDALYFQAKVQPAREKRAAELELYERAAQGALNNEILKQLVATAEYSLAAMSVATGDIDTALRLARRSFRTSMSALDRDPENAEKANRSIYSAAILGQSALYSGNTSESSKALMTALQVGRKFVVRGQDVHLWLPSSLAEAGLISARLESSTGRHETALAHYEEVIASLGPLLKGTSPDVAITRRYYSALAGKAKLNAPENTSNWITIAAAIKPRVEAHWPEGKALLAEALAYSGETAAAASIAGPLYKAGYRHPEFVLLLNNFPELKSMAGAGAEQ